MQNRILTQRISIEEFAQNGAYTTTLAWSILKPKTWSITKNRSNDSAGVILDKIEVQAKNLEDLPYDSITNPDLQEFMEKMKEKAEIIAKYENEEDYNKKQKENLNNSNTKDFVKMHRILHIHYMTTGANEANFAEINKEIKENELKISEILKNHGKTIDDITTGELQLAKLSDTEKSNYIGVIGKINSLTNNIGRLKAQKASLNLNKLTGKYIKQVANDQPHEYTLNEINANLEMLERYGIQGKKYDSYALKKKWINGKVKKEKLEELVKIFNEMDEEKKNSLFGEDLKKAEQAIEAIKTAYIDSHEITVDENFNKHLAMLSEQMQYKPDPINTNEYKFAKALQAANDHSGGMYYVCLSNQNFGKFIDYVIDQAKANGHRNIQIELTKDTSLDVTKVAKLLLHTQPDGNLTFSTTSAGNVETIKPNPNETFQDFKKRVKFATPIYRQLNKIKANDQFYYGFAAKLYQIDNIKNIIQTNNINAITAAINTAWKQKLDGADENIDHTELKILANNLIAIDNKIEELSNNQKNRLDKQFPAISKKLAEMRTDQETRKKLLEEKATLAEKQAKVDELKDILENQLRIAEIMNRIEKAKENENENEEKHDERANASKMPNLELEQQQKSAISDLKLTDNELDEILDEILEETSEDFGYEIDEKGVITAYYKDRGQWYKYTDQSQESKNKEEQKPEQVANPKEGNENFKFMPRAALHNKENNDQLKINYKALKTITAKDTAEQKLETTKGYVTDFKNEIKISEIELKNNKMEARNLSLEEKKLKKELKELNNEKNKLAKSLKKLSKHNTEETQRKKQEIQNKEQEIHNKEQEIQNKTQGIQDINLNIQREKNKQKVAKTGIKTYEKELKKIEKEAKEAKKGARAIATTSFLAGLERKPSTLTTVINKTKGELDKANQELKLANESAQNVLNGNEHKEIDDVSANRSPSGQELKATPEQAKEIIETANENLAKALKLQNKLDEKTASPSLFDQTKKPQEAANEASQSQAQTPTPNPQPLNK